MGTPLASVSQAAFIAGLLALSASRHSCFLGSVDDRVKRLTSEYPVLTALLNTPHAALSLVACSSCLPARLLPCLACRLTALAR